MLLNLFDGMPFYVLWPVLAVIGNVWYMLICGGLYLLLYRSSFSHGQIQRSAARLHSCTGWR